MKKLKNVFSGSELVDFMVKKKLAKDSKESVEIGNKLINFHYLSSASQQNQSFKNDSTLYRFKEYDKKIVAENLSISKLKSYYQIEKEGKFFFNFFFLILFFYFYFYFYFYYFLGIVLVKYFYKTNKETEFTMQKRCMLFRKDVGKVYLYNSETSVNPTHIINLNSNLSCNTNDLPEMKQGKQ